MSTEPPNKDDQLFRDDLRDSKFNARLNMKTGDLQYAYAEGYRRGANAIMRVVEVCEGDQDLLVYPIVFLRRHYVELALKMLIERSAGYLGRQLSAAEEKHLRHHDLELLWKDFRPMLEELHQKSVIVLDVEHAQGIQAHISQLVEWDRYSFSFRYSTSTDGSPSLRSDVKLVNLRHFTERMEALANYLDGVNSAMRERAMTDMS